jgi:hypothetical protein
VVSGGSDSASGEEPDAKMRRRTGLERPCLVLAAGAARAGTCVSGSCKVARPALECGERQRGFSSTFTFTMKKQQQVCASSSRLKLYTVYLLTNAQEMVQVGSCTANRSKRHSIRGS